ncbi:copper amine oxidase N-terminal domain-containing protein [Paenibacillus sp. CC-CFT747]|nr:copper amine oxidase N-terminal domain-containing protein [Paenibacillus sp. CC-CFT747]
MKAKRVAVLICVFSMLFTATVFADSLWGSYEGYSKAKVRINGSDVAFPEGDVPAFVMNGRTVLPLRQLTDSLQAMVKWDNDAKTADIYKPNVHMFFAQDVSNKDYSLQKPFAKVDQGKTVNFVVFSQVDNLKLHVDGFKISITAPSGEEAAPALEVPLDTNEESFWYPWPFKVNFTQKGNYTVKFSFLLNNEYTVVSQKVIVSE